MLDGGSTKGTPCSTSSGAVGIRRPRRRSSGLFAPTDSLYGFAERTGTYNPNRKRWEASEILTLSDGIQSTSTVEIGFETEGKITIDFLNRTKNNEPQPPLHDAFVPAEAKDEAPTLGVTPGPGFKQLKFLNGYVGKWKISGTLPEQGEWKGEEVNSWAYGKNFWRTTGWGQIGDGERFEYLIFTGWDPVKEKVFVRIVASDGTHIVRDGAYDEQTRCLTCKHVGIDPAGSASSSTVKTKFVEKDRIELEFSNRVEAGQAKLGFSLQATRIQD